uniref:Uncharacterized protein n=1 Tax=Rhizophora mucronata TaxID=61149 RepID=A0A2P2NZS1_RHIMU
MYIRQWSKSEYAVNTCFSFAMIKPNKEQASATPCVVNFPFNPHNMSIILIGSIYLLMQANDEVKSQQQTISRKQHTRCTTLTS